MCSTCLLLKDEVSGTDFHKIPHLFLPMPSEVFFPPIFFSNGETEVRGYIERATASSLWAAELPLKPWPGPESQAKQIMISHLLPPHTCSLDLILVFRSLFSSPSRISVHPHTLPPCSVDTHEVSQSP